MTGTTATRMAVGAARQRGAYAVEFALVFGLFFLVLYGVLTYGLIFTAQQSLNLAAEDGARAALRWQAGAGDASLAARAGHAADVARTRADWLGRVGGGASLNVVVCAGQGPGKTVLAGAGGAQCSAQPLQQGQIEVLVRYDYRRAPLVPELLGPLAVLTPAALVGRATVCMGTAWGFTQTCRDAAA
ncbi:TadE/TadG family type IV pilus assembly protein [Orrella sp. JC864]|uniref:TadE/TadG family type IV pilus assembly protein n=1 Tax=Orrella sp. JC864 TaxID=3120298 RepID=UPI00300BCD2E